MQSRVLYKISRYLLGALFLFSGFTKGVNPFGLSIQFGEYFSALGVEWLSPLSTLCAIGLPTMEMLLGWMLIFGLYERFTRWAVSLMMGGFTILTLWIALANPVSDCGCFGDVIKISNWATFYKNIFFSILALIFFVNKPQKGGRLTWLVVLFLLSVCAPIYAYFTLPLIDTTPYAIGLNIREQMIDNRTENPHTILIYKDIKTGKTREFEIQDTTWQDDKKWEFVESKTQNSTSGVAPKISSLAMIDERGEDRTSEVLSSKEDIYLIIAPNPNTLNERQVSKIRQLNTQNLKLILLKSMQWNNPIDGLESLTVDHSTLNTIIQNKWGGIIVLNNGVVMEKKTL